MEEQEYQQLINLLLKHVILVPDELIKHQIEEANRIIGKIDPDDVVFLATALRLDGSVVWSDDSDFEKQDRVKLFKTKDILKLFLSS